MTVNLTLIATPFVSNPLWTVEEFHQAVIDSITASTSDESVILGQVDGSAPVGDVGPWLDQGTWKWWNGSTYVPAVIKMGGPFFQITLSGAPTANRTITFPDKSGTVALTDDVYEGRGTYTLQQITSTANIPWESYDSFAISLTRDMTFTFSGSLPGHEIHVAVHQNAAWTATWPAEVHWAGGSEPADPTAGKADLLVFNNVAGVIYGRVAIDESS